MSLFKKLFGGKSTPDYPSDELVVNGEKLKITFFAHASIAIEYMDKHIYVDPVMENGEYDILPKADVILVTHSHYDHFDMAAIDNLTKGDTHILLDKTSAEGFVGDCYTMLPGAVAEPFSDIRVEAVAAYNTSEHQLQFHPKEREDCGYVVTLGGAVRIYVSGDTEPTEEMRAVKNILFLYFTSSTMISRRRCRTISDSSSIVTKVTPRAIIACRNSRTVSMRSRIRSKVVKGVLI
jgi:hypothetical protein